MVIVTVINVSFNFFRRDLPKNYLKKSANIRIDLYLKKSTLTSYYWKNDICF